jgi:Na+/phosphate symporter
LLSLNMALVGPPLVLAGVLAFRWASAVRAKNIGRIGIGLGLMLMALAGLVHTLGPLENSPMLRPLMGSLSGDPVLALLIAALMTWACHSSIAMVLLVGSFEAGHVVGRRAHWPWSWGPIWAALCPRYSTPLRELRGVCRSAICWYARPACCSPCRFCPRSPTC